MRALAITAGLSITMMAVAATACRAGSDLGSDSVTPTPEATKAAIAPDAFGGHPTELPEPVRVTEGDWVPPALEEDAYKRGVDLMQELSERGSSPITVQVNGFTVAPIEEWTPNLPCTSGAEIRADSPLVLVYLPENTYETHEPQIVVCPAGDIWMTTRSFRVSLEYGEIDRPEDRAQVTVAYFDRTRSLPLPIAEFQQVESGTINGHPAVFVKPLTPEGYGRSEILFATDHPTMGFFEVSAWNVPFEETIKIAEGLSCSEC
jgi:hypothetical protein